MNRTIKFYLFVLILITIGVVFVEVNRPKPINWNKTYSLKSKIPFGLYVFDQEADYLFGERIKKINTTAYEFFDPEYDWETHQYNIDGTFFYINLYNAIDQQSIEEVMTFVSKGNTAFIASEMFPHSLLDSLKLDINYVHTLQDSTKTYLVNPKFSDKKYNITVGDSEMYFEKIDTLNTVVLGYQEQSKLNKKQVNFVKAPYGSGTFYLHTQPTVFTNYHLLKNDNYTYTENILSYLPQNQNIYWFTKGQQGEVINHSPMRYIASQPPLRYAWYILLLTGLVFVIFNIKRKQRIVPIITPLQNTTVDFTKTIANLYYQERNHLTIMDKKITYFLEKTRTKYLIDTHDLDESFIKKLHLKSGKSQEDIERVVDLINQYRKQGSSSEQDLIDLNRAIEKLS